MTRLIMQPVDILLDLMVTETKVIDGILANLNELFQEAEAPPHPSLQTERGTSALSPVEPLPNDGSTHFAPNVAEAVQLDSTLHRRTLLSPPPLLSTHLSPRRYTNDRNT